MCFGLGQKQEGVRRDEEHSGEKGERLFHLSPQSGGH